MRHRRLRHGVRGGSLRLHIGMDLRTSGAIVLGSALVAVLHSAVLKSLPAGPFVCGLITIVLAFPLFFLITRRMTHRGWKSTIVAVSDGLLSLSERDYGLRLAERPDDELGVLVRRFNALAETMRRERNDAYQREILFETVLGTTALIVVLCNEAMQVVHANEAAARFFGRPRDDRDEAAAALEGQNFDELIEAAPVEVRDAMAAPTDVLFTHDHGEGAGPEAFYLSRRYFDISGQRHTLILLKPLTRELLRKEADTWKKAIRVLSHEMNNSLAPVTSLIHSARLMVNVPEHAGRLSRALDTIEERAEHLRTFLDGYARFARLPPPSRRAVGWQEILGGVEGLYAHAIEGEPPARAALVDPVQIQQVLINLLKNAHESGSPTDEVKIVFAAEDDEGAEIEIVDRGKGMSDEVLRNALTLFYSTKKGGTGLGLSVSREVLDAHGGRLSLHPRVGGGMAVRCWLPLEPLLPAAEALPAPSERV